MFHRVAVTLATAGAATLLGLATAAQPAQAAPGAPQPVFYTGADLTGAQTVVDTDDTSCHNLGEAALSAVNWSDVDVYAYYNADCQSGLPGQSGDTYFVLGSLHSARFAAPVLSYRVVRNG
ncbi:hypothetical protein ACFY8K_37500 [Streptomyces misionensis]|uniref:hypothetical protein n=1 Tax=Streptomyces misionensis TaxID=67331 RepID=UPI003685A33F